MLETVHYSFFFFIRWKKNSFSEKKLLLVIVESKPQQSLITIPLGTLLTISYCAVSIAGSFPFQLFLIFHWLFVHTCRPAQSHTGLPSVRVLHEAAIIRGTMLSEKIVEQNTVMWHRTVQRFISRVYYKNGRKLYAQTTIFYETNR